MITDMTTSVPVIKTAHLEGRNIHLIHFLYFGNEAFAKTKQNNGVFAQNNVKM